MAEGTHAAGRTITGEDLDKVKGNAKLTASIMEAAALAEDAQQTGVLRKLLSAAHELTRQNLTIMEEWGVE